MKTIFAFFSLTFIVVTSVFAQEEYNTPVNQSLFSNGARITGWFIDFSNAYTILNGNYSHLPGFSGGVTMNRNFKIGFFGKSLTCHETYLEFNNLFSEPVYLVGGYGGLLLESSPLDNKVFHLTFPFQIGAGGAEYLSKEKYPDLEEIDEFDFCRRHVASSPFWTFEPGASLECNITGFMRIYAGYSYRWFFGMNLENTHRNAFNGSNFNFGIKFGKW